MMASKQSPTTDKGAPAPQKPQGDTLTPPSTMAANQQQVTNTSKANNLQQVTNTTKAKNLHQVSLADLANMVNLPHLANLNETGLASFLRDEVPIEISFFKLPFVAIHSDCEGLCSICDLGGDRSGSETEHDCPKDPKTGCEDMKLLIDVDLRLVSLKSLQELMAHAIEDDTEHWAPALTGSVFIQDMEVSFRNSTGTDPIQVMTMSDMELQVLFYKIAISPRDMVSVSCDWGY